MSGELKTAYFYYSRGGKNEGPVSVTLSALYPLIFVS